MTVLDARGDPATIDAPWMTEALQDAGVANGATVVDVDFEGYVGTGQMSRNGRFRLSWDCPDGDPDRRPATVVGKFPSDDPPTRVASFANGVYGNEVSFYRDLAPTVDICTPACWVARYDEDDAQFVLIMEDLADSQQGDQLGDCSVDEIALAVDEAVGLHAPRWGDPSLLRHARFQTSADERAANLQLLYGAALEIFLGRLGARLDDGVIETVERFGRVVGEWSRGPGTPPTIVHGDFRPDNFLFGQTPEAPPLAVVDWQTVAAGLGISDVAYLLGGAIPTEQRRAVEREIVTDYRHRMGAAGVDYAADDCWRDYRWGSLHGLLITVVATMTAEQTERGDDMFTLMATRHARQVLDLEALDLVAGLTETAS